MKMDYKQEGEEIMLRLFGDDNKVGKKVEEEFEAIGQYGEEGKG